MAKAVNTWGKVAKLTNWSYVLSPEKSLLCYLSLLIEFVGRIITIPANFNKHVNVSQYITRTSFHFPELASTINNYLQVFDQKITTHKHRGESPRSPEIPGSLLVSLGHVELCFCKKEKKGRVRQEIRGVVNLTSCSRQRLQTTTLPHCTTVQHCTLMRPWRHRRAQTISDRAGGVRWLISVAEPFSLTC